MTTSERVMEALVDVIVDGGLPEFSVQQVADRAGVSHRTVYRHFPTREALLEGLTRWVEERMGFAGGLPTDTTSLPAQVGHNFRVFELDHRSVEALVRLGVGANLEASPRRRRTDAFRRIINKEFPDLDRDAVRLGAAAIRVLASSRTWLNLREAGLDGDQAARAAGWLVAIVLDALATGNTADQQEE